MPFLKPMRAMFGVTCATQARYRDRSPPEKKPYTTENAMMPLDVVITNMQSSRMPADKAQRKAILKLSLTVD